MIHSWRIQLPVAIKQNFSTKVMMNKMRKNWEKFIRVMISHAYGFRFKSIFVIMPTAKRKISGVNWNFTEVKMYSLLLLLVDELSIPSAMVMQMFIISMLRINFLQKKISADYRSFNIIYGIFLQLFSGPTKFIQIYLLHWNAQMNC